MDERNHPKAVSAAAGKVAAKQGTLPGADSSVAFFGDSARVAEGFAIALRAMGVDQVEPGEDPDA